MKKTPIESKQISDAARVYKLKEPVNFGGENVETLFFKKAKGKHFKGMPVGNLNTDQLFLLASRLCDVPPSFFEEMDGADAVEVLQIASSFIMGSQAIGETV